MPSANGYSLVVNRQGAKHVVTATWAAPFYVLDTSYDDPEDEPMLIHCETLDDAKARLDGGNYEHQQARVILNADFTEYEDESDRG